MIKKRTIATYFFAILFSVIAVLLLFYQIYITKKMSEEIIILKELRIYYIEFLNVVTEHLKKNTKLVILSSKCSFFDYVITQKQNESNKKPLFKKRVIPRKKIIKKKINKNKKSNPHLFKEHFQIEIMLSHPLKQGSFWMSSPYGLRYNKKKKKYEMHHGVDFAAVYGTPVYAAAEGVIIETSIKKNGFGKSIVILHGNGVSTRYAHLSKILVFCKQEIKRGDLIGLVGATGNTRGRKSGSHLHFEVIVNKKRYDPLLYI